MKKSIIISLLILSFIGIRLNVFAASESARPGEDNYSQMQSMYNKYANGGKISVSDQDVVTIYGRSICSGTSCTYNYAGLNVGQDFKAALSKIITCTNGATKISFQDGDAPTAKKDFMDNNKDNASGTVYWSEQYYVACTNNGSIEVEEEQIQQEADNNGNGGTANDGNSQNGNTSGGGYNTSTPGDQEELGVSTYFVVLGMVSIISYVCMIIVKKHNLFKKI